MIPHRPIARLLLACAAAAAALTSSGRSFAQQADPFSVVPFVNQAFFSCEDVQVNGTTNSTGGTATNQGHVLSNGRITVNGGAQVNGNATPGPGQTVTGSGTVTGVKTAATVATSCTPVANLPGLVTSLQAQNDNGRLSTLNPNPLQGTSFTLNGGQEVTLPAGTFYFTQLTINGGATLTLSGMTKILVNGDVAVNGQVNSGRQASNPSNLRILTTGSFSLNGGAFIRAYVHVPSQNVALGSNLTGGLFAKRVTVNAGASVTRWLGQVDLGPPTVTIASPTNGSSPTDLAAVIVTGTVSDPDGAATVTVTVNGVIAPVTPATPNTNGTYTTTLDMRHVQPPVVTAVATDAAGQTATQSVTLCGPPAVALTSPAPGDTVATRNVTLTGTSGNATSVTVNGLSVTALSNGLFTFTNFDLGVTQGAKTLTIVATGPCGSTTITAVITYSTVPPDRFALQTWMTGQAVFARQSALVDNGARVSSLGSGANGAPTNQGHVISNGTITVKNNAVVDGNALAGPPPSPTPTVQNNGQVTGTKGNLTVARTEFPVDLSALTTQVQAQNNNGTIPRTGQNRDPLEGAGHTEFRLQNNDSLTLPAGTYYFTKLTIDNNATLTVSGRVNVLCTGQVALSNNVNHQTPAGSPFNIRLWASGTADVNLGNNLTLGAFVYAPNAKVVLDNNATLVGGIFAKSVEVKNNGFVKRRLDSGPPTLTVLEPANGATPANPAAVRVRGTATDTDSPVVVTINGAPVTLSGGAFDTTVDVRSLNPAVLTVVATDSVGNTDTKTISLNVCTVGPVVTLTSPPTFVKTRTVAVQGTCGAATAVTVNGQNATLTSGVYNLTSLDLGAGDGPKTLTIVASAPGCPTTTQPFTVTLDTLVPTVAIDTPTTGATVTTSPLTVGGPVSDANLLSVTVNGVTTTTFTGGRFSVAVPLTSGSNTLVATAVDRAGNGATSNSVAVTYTPSGSSSVSVDPPATALVATKRISVTGSYSGPVQSITVLGVPAQLGVPSAGRFTAANVELQEGPQPVKAIATETGGGRTLSAAVTWELDSTPPTVTIDTPALSPACRGASPSVTLSGKYADLHAATTNAVSVEIRPSGGGAAVTQVAIVDAATGRWTLTGASLGTADGNATVTVTAKDSLNQKSTSIASWRIDTVTPTVSLLLDGAPFPGSAAGIAPPAGTTPTLFGRIVTVRAAVQDGAQATPPTAVLTLDGQPYVEGTPIAIEGDHTVVARATDCAAHDGNACAYFRIDRTGPQLTSTTPTEAAKVSTVVTTYSGTANTPLSSAKLNGADATVNGSGFSLAPFPWKEGLNRVAIDLKDGAGNETSYSRTFTVKTLGPKLEILESGLPLSSGATFYRTVTPTLRSDDPDATVTATLDGQPYTSGTAITAAGSHTLAGTARDSVNHTDTKTVGFTIDLSAGPTIAITSPAEAAVLPGPNVTATGTTGATTTSVSVNGRAVTPAAGSWSVAGVPLEADLPTDLVAVARDAQGRTATATRTVLSRSSGPRILILEPSTGFSTNRGKIDVAGAIVGGPSFTANGTVTIAPQGAAPVTAALDVTGAFRARDIPLVDGTNTITVSATDAQGRTTSQTVTGGIDRTPPTVVVTVNGQPLAEGSQFSFAVTLRIEVSDNAAPVPTPTIRLNGEEKPATSPATDLAISQAGGYVITVVARDSVGNETRASRSFIIDLGGCTLSDLDPPSGTGTAQSTVTVHGKSGTAATITVRVPNPNTSPVTYTDYPAQVADSTFAVADVPLPAVGDNALQIVCTDRSGQSTSQPLTIRRLPQGGGPSLSITAPTTGARVSTPTVAIAGTITDPGASVFVNGQSVVVNAAGLFTATSTVVDGPNVLFAHGVDAAGRTADARVVVFRDSTAPRIQITSPQNEQRIGPVGAAPLRVDVTGTVEIETEPNLATVTAQTPAGSVTATVDPNTGAFRAPDVPLAATTTPQTLTVTAVDTLGQTSQVTLTVLADPQGPAIRLTQPQDLTRYNASAPATVPVTGEAWATTGAQISVNGGGIDPATLAWSAAGPDGRRSASFGAQVPVPATDGAFGVIARVEQPGGKLANDKRLLVKDATAPSALDLVPTDGAAQVDPNAMLLALFSEPVRKDSLSSTNGLILTRVGTTEPVAGTYTIAGNAVAFAPGAALQRGQSYRFKAGAGVTDIAGVALSPEKQVTFTVALSSTETAPTLDPIAPVLCANTLHVKGSSVPGATVKIRDGDLTFTGNANAQGRFDIEIPLSGNGFHSLHVFNTAGGLSSPEATALFRVDCNAPAVITSSFDRATAQITVSFSEAMSAASLVVGAPSDSIRITDAEDATHPPQTATVSLSPTGNTATLQLPTAANAWWRNRSVQLDVRAPAADVRGNLMASTYTTVFFVGGGGGDLSGSFLSGEAYDDESGRPLESVNAKLFASGVALPGTVPPGSVPAPTNAATTDGRGRFAMAGSVTSGRYALVLEKTGYTRVLRRLPLDAGIGAVPFDARLTPLLAPSATALVPATGGAFDGPTGSLLKLDVAATAVTTTATSLSVGLTPLSGQGLPELLPLGFTPLAAAHLRLEAAGDPMLETGTPFSATGVKLTLPLPTGLDASAQLFAVRYDLLSGSWITLPAVERTVGADGIDRAKVTLTSPGAVAVVIPDADAATRPPIPSGPNVALIGSTLPATIPALTGTLTLNPPIVPPTGKSTAKVIVRATNGTSPWPSGLALNAYLDEKLILSSGETLFEAPFSVDLVAYHPPLTPAEQSPNTAGSVGAMSFRVSPSPKAAQVLLDSGYDNIRLFPFPDQIERGTVLGPAGGTITNDDGVELTLAEGALTSKTVVSARLLTSAELSSYPIPQGYDRLAAIRVDLSGFTLNRPATVRLNTPNGTTPDPDPRVILSSFVDQPVDGRGSFFRLVARATRSGSPEKITAAPEPASSGLPLEGLVKEGVYFVLRAQQSIGYSSGFVKAANGFGYTGARVTATGLGTADITIPGGRYSVPVTAGAAKSVEARHPDRDERGTATIASLAANQVVQQDITITPAPPQITGFQPANGATNQPIGSVLRVQFNKALDPASVGQSAIKAEIANPDGTGTGAYAIGTVSLASNNTAVVFTPTRPLPPGRTILASFTGGVRSTEGTLFAGTVPTVWSFTTSTQVVYGGQVNAAKIRIFIPVNGVAQIVGEAGALPLSPGTPWAVTTDVDGPIVCPTTTVPANSQGGFTTSAGCAAGPVTLDSKVYAKILDPAGNVAEVFRLTPFTTTDGRGFVAPAGEETTFVVVGGIEVKVPATAFDRATLVTVTTLDPATLGVTVPAGMEVGAYLNVDFEGTAKETLRLRFPVTTQAPVGTLVFAGTPYDVSWGKRLRIMDLGRIIDGGGGAKVLSTYAQDQPSDPIASARAPLGPGVCPDPNNPCCPSACPSGSASCSICPDATNPSCPTCQVLKQRGCATRACNPLAATALLEMTTRASAAYVFSRNNSLAAVTGLVDAGSAIGSVIYNLLADLFIFIPPPHDWNGAYILPGSTSAPFTIVKRDGTTGWVTSQRDYQAVTQGPRIVDLRALDAAVTAAPVLVDASPFALSRFKASSSVGTCTSVRLELDACTTALGVVTLGLSSTAKLPKDSRVTLYNISPTLTATPVAAPSASCQVAADGSFVNPLGSPCGLILGVSPEDELLAVVSPGDLDPDTFSAFRFSFDRVFESSDLGTRVSLKDCGLLPATPGGACTDFPFDARPDATLQTLEMRLSSLLPRGHLFELSLSNITTQGASPKSYLGPSLFRFATRKASETAVGQTKALSLGDTDSARDMLKFGNLLLVASATGNLVALDLSAPLAETSSPIGPKSIQPALYAALSEAPSQIRTLATDGHDRVFFAAATGTGTWAVRSVRVEDILGSQQPDAACVLPASLVNVTPRPNCFHAPLGAVRIAMALGSSSGLTGSEYLSIAGSLPTGVPTRIEVVADDHVEPQAGRVELKSFYARFKSGGGAGAPPELPPGQRDDRGFYTFGVALSVTDLPAPRTPTCGQDKYRHQRATVDNLTTGQSWSFDIDVPGYPGNTGNGTLVTPAVLRAREGDELRVRFNRRALGYIALVGGGISLVDLNRIYDTPTPLSTGQLNKSECGRRLLTYEGQDFNLETCAGRSNFDGLRMSPSVAALGVTGGVRCNAVRGGTASQITVLSPLLHYGSIRTETSFAELGGVGLGVNIAYQEKDCLAGRIPTAPGNPVILRDVALVTDLHWDALRTCITSFERGPEPKTGDLAFFSLGYAGVEIYDVSDRTLKEIGRFRVPSGSAVFRLQVDKAAKRLYGGGTKLLLDGTLQPTIFVWDITRPALVVTTADDPRLILSIPAPWDTPHIAIDESGLLYTWGQGGGKVIPVADPSFAFAGRYRDTNVEAMSVYKPATRFSPLGVPTRASQEDEIKAESKALDEKSLTPAFKVRVALPAGLGDTLTAKVQTLRALADSRQLSKDGLGSLIAMPGGAGFPEREVYVTLKRISYSDAQSEATSRSGRRTGAGSFYESLETVLLIADPRAKSDYTRQQLTGGTVSNEPADEETQCRRCERPLHIGSDPAVRELLAGGPYVRAYLSVDPGATQEIRLATADAMAFFDVDDAGGRRDNYRAPVGVAAVSGWADEIPSPTQIALAEPPLNPSMWMGEAGSGVSLVSGEGILQATDRAVAGRSLGFSFTRTYRSSFLGYGPLGSAGWNADLFAHLREIPLEGGTTSAKPAYVEYHDGTGHVFRFVTPVDGACPSTKLPSTGAPEYWEPDGTGFYCVPYGLEMTLRKRSTGGWQLISRTNDITTFDEKGRLVEISDRHRRGSADPKAKGSTVRLYYDAAGQLSRVEDELERTYTFTYETDYQSPSFGLLRGIRDFSERTVDYEYQPGSRLLSKVNLPRVGFKIPAPGGGFTEGAGQPTLTYSYGPAVGVSPASTQAPLHGPFAQQRLWSMRLPQFLLGGGNTDRVSFEYDAQTARVTAITVPNTEGRNDASGSLRTRFVGTPRTVRPAIAESVEITPPWNHPVVYNLFERGFTRSIAAGADVEVFNAPLGDGPSGSPSITPSLTAARPATAFTYENDGRIATVTGPDGAVTTYAYVPLCATPGACPILAKANTLYIGTSFGSGDRGTAAYTGFRSTVDDRADNIPKKVTIDIGTDETAALKPVELGTITVEPGPGGQPPTIVKGYPADGVTSEIKVVDPFGRPSTVEHAKGSGTPAGAHQPPPSAVFTETLTYGRYPTSADGQGLLESRVIPGTGITETYTYDDPTPNKRGNVSVRKTSHGVKDTFSYDEWDRLVAATLGGETSSPTRYRPVDAKIEKGYDQAGHLVRERRYQLPVGWVDTQYTYDAREEIVEIRQGGVATNVLDSSTYRTVSLTRDFDLATGLLHFETQDRDVAAGEAGIKTEYLYDAAGRVKSWRRVASGADRSGEHRIAYDIASRPVFETDSELGASYKKFDALDRPYFEALPTGARIERTFDKQDRAINEAVFETRPDPLDPTKTVRSQLAERSATHSSYGLVTQTERITAGTGTGKRRTNALVRDGAGRVVDAYIEDADDPGNSATSRRIAHNEFEPATGRPILQIDALGNTLGYHYPHAGTPWPDQIIRSETAPQGSSINITTAELPEYDTLGRVVKLTAADGTVVERTLDEAGNALSVTTGGENPIRSSYDGRGIVVSAERQGVPGSLVSYSYDAGGRLTAKKAERDTSTPDLTQYSYDSVGRLQTRRRPGSGLERFDYNTDDTLLTFTTRLSSALGRPLIVTYGYDAANRLISRTPNSVDFAGSGLTPGLAPVDAGDRATYDGLSRLTSASIHQPIAGGQTTPDLPSVVGYSGFDMRGLPASESVGFLVSPILRRYDLFGNTTSVTLPGELGVGASFAGYARQFNRLDNLTKIQAADAAGNALTPLNLGVEYDFGGMGRLHAFRTLGPQVISETLSYNGSGARLSALTLGTQAGALGRFGFDWRTSQDVKQGRTATTAPTAFDLTQSAGYAFGHDTGHRLNQATSPQGAWSFGYGRADELKTVTEPTGVRTGTSGAEGRLTSLGSTTFGYDDEGRRTSDERNTYTWDWRGRLLTVDVKPTAPVHANEQIVYTYDALGRLLTRLLRGPRPPGSTDDNDRTKLDRRVFVWDGASLVTETGLNLTDPLLPVWRRANVPGPTGMDDSFQARLETNLQGTSQARTFGFVKDELGTTLGVLEDKSGQPSLLARYLQSPYGEIHLESGPELLKAEYDPALTHVGSTTQTTTSTPPNETLPGALKATTTLPIDTATHAAGVVVERFDGTSSTWLLVAPAEYVVGRDDQDANTLVVMRRNGWAKATKYRVRLKQDLKDGYARAFVPPQSGATEYDAILDVPSSGTQPPVYSQKYPLTYDSAKAASDTLTGAFPGGQTALYTGVWTDPITGLGYLRARWYDPRTGHFLSEDPLGDVDSPNMYAYVGWRPNEKTDPTGASPTVISGLVGGAVGGLAGGAYGLYRSSVNDEEFKWSYVGQGALAGAAIGSGAALLGLAGGASGGAAFALEMGGGAAVGAGLGGGLGSLTSSGDWGSFGKGAAKGGLLGAGTGLTTGLLAGASGFVQFGASTLIDTGLGTGLDYAFGDQSSTFGETAAWNFGFSLLGNGIGFGARSLLRHANEVGRTGAEQLERAARPGILKRSRRVIYDDRAWGTVRRERNVGLLNTADLSWTWEHFLIRQQRIAQYPVLRGFGNSYLNTALRIPRGWNSRLGNNFLMRQAFRIGVPAATAAAGYVGYEIGGEINRLLGNDR